MHLDQFLAVETIVRETDSPDQRSFFSRLRATCLEPFRNSTGGAATPGICNQGQAGLVFPPARLWSSKLEATALVRMRATIPLPNRHLLDIFCASEHQPLRIGTP